MAELESQRCTLAAQESCCRTGDKASCCGESHSSSYGCGAGAVSATALEVREPSARSTPRRPGPPLRARLSGCCCPADETGVFGAALYAETDEHEAPDAAIGASLGCGVPTAVADLHAGDVVISNCVINLSGDKPRVLAEAARVLRPGGRFAISDVIADADVDAVTRAGQGCLDRLYRWRAATDASQPGRDHKAPAPRGRFARAASTGEPRRCQDSRSQRSDRLASDATAAHRPEVS